jgi:exonuclease III
MNRMSAPDGYNPASMIPSAGGIIHAMRGGGDGNQSNGMVSLIPYVPGPDPTPYKGGAYPDDEKVVAVSAVSAKLSRNQMNAPETQTQLQPQTVKTANEEPPSTVNGETQTETQTKKVETASTPTTSTTLLTNVAQAENQPVTNETHTTPSNARSITLFGRRLDVRASKEIKEFTADEIDALHLLGVEDGEESLKKDVIQALYDGTCDTDLPISMLLECEPIRRIINSLIEKLLKNLIADQKKEEVPINELISIKKKQQKNTATLMTFNVFMHKCNKNGQSALSLINSSKCDIVCTQEDSNSNHTSLYKMAGLCGAKQSETERMYVKKGDTSHSDMKCIMEGDEMSVKTLSRTIAIPKRSAMVFMYQDVKIANVHMEGGQNTDIALVHPEPAIRNQLLERKMGLLRDIIKEDPDIILGDFNSIYDESGTYDKIDYAYYEKLKKANHKNEPLSAEEKESITQWSKGIFDELKKSYTYSKPSNHDKLVTNSKGIIDMFWYKTSEQNCKLENTKIEDKIQSTNKNTECTFSDHNPVVTTIRFTSTIKALTAISNVNAEAAKRAAILAADPLAASSGIGSTEVNSRTHNDLRKQALTKEQLQAELRSISAMQGTNLLSGISAATKDTDNILPYLEAASIGVSVIQHHDLSDASSKTQSKSAILGAQPSSAIISEQPNIDGQLSKNAGDILPYLEAAITGVSVIQQHDPSEASEAHNVVADDNDDDNDDDNKEDDDAVQILPYLEAAITGVSVIQQHDPSEASVAVNDIHVSIINEQPDNSDAVQILPYLEAAITGVSVIQQHEPSRSVNAAADDGGEDDDDGKDDDDGEDDDAVQILPYLEAAITGVSIMQHHNVENSINPANINLEMVESHINREIPAAPVSQLQEPSSSASLHTSSQPMSVGTSPSTYNIAPSLRQQIPPQQIIVPSTSSSEVNPIEAALQSSIKQVVNTRALQENTIYAHEAEKARLGQERNRLIGEIDTIKGTFKNTLERNLPPLQHEITTKMNNISKLNTKMRNVQRRIDQKQSIIKPIASADPLSVAPLSVDLPSVAASSVAASSADQPVVSLPIEPLSMAASSEPAYVRKPLGVRGRPQVPQRSINDLYNSLPVTPETQPIQSQKFIEPSLKQEYKNSLDLLIRNIPSRQLFVNTYKQPNHQQRIDYYKEDIKHTLSAHPLSIIAALPGNLTEQIEAQRNRLIKYSTELDRVVIGTNTSSITVDQIRDKIEDAKVKLIELYTQAYGMFGGKRKTHKKRHHKKRNNTRKK